MSRPLVTFMLFAYNQERYIREAVRGALAQTYSPLEIILSDDCSQDETFEIIRQEVADYEGPHKIVLNRNEENLGIGGHVNRLMELAQGELIVAAAGDDISLPSRSEELVRAWSKGESFSVYSNATIIDEDGSYQGDFAKLEAAPLKSWREVVRSGRGVFGCTHAWDRAVFDIFGPLPSNVVGEDILVSYRSALLGRMTYVNRRLVKYRRHRANLSRYREHILKMNLPQFVSWEVTNAQAERIHYESWLSDTRLLLSRYPEKRAETLRAIKSIKAKIALCELTASANGDRWSRWRTCLSSMKHTEDIGLKQAARTCILLLSPWALFNIQKRRAKLSRWVYELSGATFEALEEGDCDERQLT